MSYGISHLLYYVFENPSCHICNLLQVIHWKGHVDRSCIERLRAFQNPPMLVGHVMEMVMTLIGKRLPSQKTEVREMYPSKDEMSGKFSTSSGSTKQSNPIKKRQYLGSDD